MAWLAAAPSAHAHGFGQRYELPVPLPLYLFGAAAAVALSFVVFGLFMRGGHVARMPREYPLLAALSRLVSHPAVIVTVRMAALALFIVTVLAGFFGDQNPYRNIAPTLVWIVWWVGLVYVSAFVGDLWSLINPWRTVYDAVAWLCRRLGWRHDLSLRLPYPPALGAWPACLLLLAVAWIELIDPRAAEPRHIACLAAAYSVLTWAGMLAFGRDAWLRHGEVFSLMFGTFARLAPVGARDGRLLLRPFGSGLLEDRLVSTSVTAFVLLLLATVLYDGLIGTGEWAMLEEALRPSYPGTSDSASMVTKTLGLFAVWLLFLAAYIGVSAIMSALAGGRTSMLDVARRFAITLIPIAIGYHVAHYLVFLLVQGQYVIPLLSDPFGYGWNVFGTAAYRVDIGLVGARFAWYAAVAAIVVGHVAAVYAAHVKALGIFAAPGAAVRTQVPLTALMVVYTFIGLSITAQPIVESRADVQPPAVTRETVAIPPDAVFPGRLGGGLAADGLDQSAEVKLTYKVLGSAFHDATKTSAADLIYAYVFAYRWGARASGEGPRYDPFIDAATASLRRHLVAVRVAGVDAAAKSFRVGDVAFVREVFTVEVYLAIAPDDPEWNAVAAPPWSTVPWHVLVLMEEAVARGWAAFSQAEAARRGIPWLDLVRSQELNAKLGALAARFEREAFRPPALAAHVTEEDARKRWAALAAFHQASGHFLVTNGPYKVKSWTPQSVTLEAFRDLTYPLGVGSYDAYAVPRRGFVTKAEWDGERLLLSGDIEVIEKFQRSYRLVRMSLQSVSPVVSKRASPECRYIVTAADGRVVAAGAAPLGADARFHIDLKDRLPPGDSTLSAVIAVNGNVMNTDVRRCTLTRGGEGCSCCGR